MISFSVAERTTLKAFTDTHHPQASFYFSTLLKNKEIKVNGKRVSADQPLYVGDFVEYYLTQKQMEKTGFSVLYEDENLLIVDKESGVNSEAVFSVLSQNGECYFIHRLDRNTQGLLAFAKTESANAALLAAFQERSVEKIYHALCFGRLPKRADVLTAYLKKDAQRAQVKVYATPVSGSEKIITEYEVMEETDGVSRLKIRLHTGKTHQIRAHFAFLGCPVVGDMRYGDTAKNRAKNRTRQCLIAKELTFFTQGEFGYLNGKTFRSNFTF